MTESRRMTRPLLTFDPAESLWRISSAYAEYTDRDSALYDEPGEFYTSQFIQSNTRFDTFDEFRGQSPWEMQTWAGVQQIPDARLDSYVGRTTRFDSWQKMKTQAATRNILDRYTV